jgi:hypothetical protein
LKRRRAIPIVVVTGVLVFSWWLLISERQTRYQGKSVHQWASELHTQFEPRGTNAPAQAFQSLGAKAVPDLRRLVVATPPFYEDLFLRHGSKLPRRVRAFLAGKIKPGQTVELQIGALRALATIGPPGASALPEMLSALTNRDTRVHWVAAQSIAALGQPGVEALLPLTTNVNPAVRHVAVYALGEARTNAVTATPQLLACTLDATETVRASAYYSLGRIGPAGLPVATELAVNHPDPRMRTAAFRGLTVLAPAGQIHLGKMLSATNHAEIRRLALLSLIRGRQTNQFARRLFADALNDPDANVREVAQLGLHWLDTGSLRRPAPTPAP